MFARGRLTLKTMMEGGGGLEATKLVGLKTANVKTDGNSLHSHVQRHPTLNIVMEGAVRLH